MRKNAAECGRDALFHPSFPGFSNCIEDELTHAIALNPGAGARRVKVRWGHAIAELDDKLDIDFDIGTTVTLESGSVSWNGAASFIVRDDDDIALVVNGENGISVVGDTRIEQGFWVRVTWVGVQGRRKSIEGDSRCALIDSIRFAPSAGAA